MLEETLPILAPDILDAPPRALARGPRSSGPGSELQHCSAEMPPTPEWLMQERLVA